MRSITSSILGSLVVCTLFATEPVKHIDIYQIDTKSSKLEWSAKKVTGAHNGTIQITGGKIMVDHGTIGGGSFEIDMGTITCTDMEGEYKEKLEKHLRSEDFFNVADHPTAKLEMTKVERGAAGSTVTANLTIKGITNAITFPARVRMEGGSLDAHAEFQIDRSKWQIKYGSGTFFEDLGDNLIYDEIRFKVTLSAKAY